MLATTKTKFVVIAGYVMLGLIVGVLIWLYLRMEDNYESRIESMTIEASRVRETLQDRVIRESEEVALDTRAKSLLEAFNSHLALQFDEETVYVGGKHLFPEYKRVLFECNTDGAESDLQTTSIKQRFKIEGQIIGWCRTEESGLLIVQTDLMNLVGYLVNLGEDASLISKTDLIGQGNSLSEVELEVLEWRQFNFQFGSKDRIVFQIVESMTGQELFWEQSSDKNRRFVYIISGENPGVLVEVCRAQECSHVVKTAYPVIGK